MLSSRPKLHDIEVRQVVAEKLFPLLVRWLNSNGDATDYAEPDNKEELEKQIHGLLHGNSLSDDGYRLARWMEKDGWDPDTELVDILDHVPGYAREALRQASIKWWTAQNHPQYKDGVRVKVLDACRNDAKGHIGIICGSHADGKYTVNIPEMGHVQPGKSGMTGIILEHELLEVVI